MLVFNLGISVIKNICVFACSGSSSVSTPAGFLHAEQQHRGRRCNGVRRRHSKQSGRVAQLRLGWRRARKHPGRLPAQPEPRWRDGGADFAAGAAVQRAQRHGQSAQTVDRVGAEHPGCRSHLNI